MRFMIIVKATADSEHGTMPPESLIAQMGDYHEALAKAGMLLDATGLAPSSRGWRIRYDGQRRTHVDGPFVETKELIAGYTLIKAQSREEAMEWIARFPNPSIDGGHAEIEVRPLMELEDFPPSDAIERFRDVQAAAGKSV